MAAVVDENAGDSECCTDDFDNMVAAVVNVAVADGTGCGND